MTRKIRFLLALSALFTNLALAQSTPHTWHTIRSTNGTWSAQLQMINQGGSFVARDGSSLSRFTISPSQPQEYGFIFDADADFDVAYTLTLTQQEEIKRFSSRACVYVITASGPARPDVRVSSFNGAKCGWDVVDGVGEDFVVG